MNLIHIYGDPDHDGEIRFDVETSRLFVINDAEGMCAYSVIGQDGLRALAAKLLELAKKVEVKQ